MHVLSPQQEGFFVETFFFWVIFAEPLYSGELPARRGSCLWSSCKHLAADLFEATTSFGFKIVAALILLYLKLLDVSFSNALLQQSPWHPPELVVVLKSPQRHMTGGEIAYGSYQKETSPVINAAPENQGFGVLRLLTATSLSDAIYL